uniref:Murine leukemia virus integrase C-terminal domain-containing protein n=1 Tax=Pseudonaja textilis TaxID=8673 RepID=A0A670ZPW7_PSETE
MTKVREDLEETPLKDGERWFVDGSSRVEEGKRNQHPHEVGDWILIKTWKNEKLQPSWEGPYQVLLTTESAVRTREGGWTHYSRVKRAPEPEKPWKAIPVDGQPLKLTLNDKDSNFPYSTELREKRLRDLYLQWDILFHL